MILPLQWNIAGAYSIFLLVNCFDSILNVDRKEHSIGKCLQLSANRSSVCSELEDLSVCSALSTNRLNSSESCVYSGLWSSCFIYKPSFDHVGLFVILEMFLLKICFMILMIFLIRIFLFYLFPAFHNNIQRFMSSGFVRALNEKMTARRKFRCKADQ